MSYYYLRGPISNAEDVEPEEPASHLEVGECRIEGAVEVRRAGEQLYVAECSGCGWRTRHSSPGVANWSTFAHNSNRRRHGCPPNPVREDV